MPDKTCPNGHPANSSGNCFESSCTYNNDSRNDPVPPTGRYGR